MSFYEELVGLIPTWQDAEYEACKQRIRGGFKMTPFASYIYIGEHHECVKERLIKDGFKVTPTTEFYPIKWKIEL